MYFIERFKISKNVIFNILKVIIVLYSITLVTIQIDSMKKSLDKLYSNSFLSISKLNKANKIYHLNIKNNIYQAINLSITPNQALLDMKNSLPIVKKIWKDYEKNFQHNDKIEYLEYALLEIESINNYFNDIGLWCSNIKQMQMLSLKDIDKKIAKANIIIQELINYELQVAQQERRSVLEKFETFIYQIIFSLLITIPFIVHYIYLINNKRLLLKQELQKITSSCEILENLEYNDSLTSLYNRRYFNYIYKDQLEMAKERNNCITLIMVDIDCFAEYNSFYGYAKGDETLILIANILQDISDKNDFVFRFNGEAFVILLTQTDEKKSIVFTNSISQIVREKKIEHKGSKTDNILTVSVGMAYSTMDNLTTEYSLISDADKMLSIAKENGRDRAEISKGKQTMEKSNSLMAKYLTQDISNQLKDKKTPNGYTLQNLIASGKENLDSGIGAYAGDLDSYEVFAPLLDPIIQEYHSFSKEDKHKSDFNSDNFTASSPDIEGKYILSTRIRVARNIADLPLGTAISNEQRNNIEKDISKILSEFNGSLEGKYYSLNKLDDETRASLIKEHFLFKAGDRFLESAGLNRDWPNGRGIFHNNEKTFLVWVNEEDQLRIISMQKGGDIKEVFTRLSDAIKQLEKKVSFSYSEHLGYITSCPTNLGTAMRASVHIKLPNLSKNMEEFRSITERYNVQIRGIDGEHSDTQGAIFDISNKRRLGVTEVECIQDMYNGVVALIKKEKELNNEISTNI